MYITSTYLIALGQNKYYEADVDPLMQTKLNLKWGCETTLWSKFDVFSRPIYITIKLLAPKSLMHFFYTLLNVYKKMQYKIDLYTVVL